MHRPEPELVSVIIPAYFAEETIAETLESACSQSYTNLEIIVVDDGSLDGTAAAVERYRALDQRITLIRQPNSGVAVSRNTAIARARGEFIAPLDADDLWRTDKIEKQVRRFREGGTRTGLVYCWFAIIDGSSHITAHEARNGGEGDVLREMCLRNLVGNGSAPLILTKAIREVGGYDPELRARGAEGCEDFKLYFRIAEHYEFLLVPEYLVGYRQLADNMSSNIRAMLRSRDLCNAELAADHPEYAAEFSQGRMRLMRFMLARSVRFLRFRDAAWLLRRMFQNDPASAFWSLVALVGRAFLTILRLITRLWAPRFEIGSFHAPVSDRQLPKRADTGVRLD